MRFTTTFSLLLAGTASLFAQTSNNPNQTDGNPGIQISTANFSTFSLEPAALPAFPYCTGERPSTVSVLYSATAGTVFGPENIFQLEVSDVLGNFDNSRYPARFVGSTKSSSASDTLFNVRLPDNLPFNPPAVGSNRYRVRLRSTDPAFVSAPSAEIPNWNLCPSRLPKMYSSTLRPLNRFYAEGQTVSMTIFKDPILVPTVGDIIRIQLSDTNGIFRGVGVVTTQLDSVPAAFVGDSMVVSFTFPIIRPALPHSLRYRVRPVLASQPLATSTTTGHDLRIDTVTSNRQKVKSLLRVYPNPANGVIFWQLPNQQHTVQAEIISVSGIRFALPTTVSSASVSHLPPGVYILRVSTNSAIYQARVTINK